MKITNRKMASEICKKEGGKSEARLMDVMQCLVAMFEILSDKDDSVIQEYIETQILKAKKKLKKQKS